MCKVVKEHLFFLLLLFGYSYVVVGHLLTCTCSVGNSHLIFTVPIALMPWPLNCQNSFLHLHILQSEQSFKLAALGFLQGPHTFPSSIVLSFSHLWVARLTAHFHWNGFFYLFIIIKYGFFIWIRWSLSFLKDENIFSNFLFILLSFFHNSLNPVIPLSLWPFWTSLLC